ncbi:MAG: hypothetical protein DMF81_04225 [Acidobacteria bacterium]|nr:MAG: hypothetical protein DMF81_04225 [Acidobacteriota bacterium]
MAVFLSVLSTFLVGLILVIAPWTSLWDANYLLSPYPALRGLLLSAFTRGTVSGLGLVNIVLALYEARQHMMADDGA